MYMLLRSMLLEIFSPKLDTPVSPSAEESPTTPAVDSWEEEADKDNDEGT